jgi:hypothetical protein
VISHIKSSELGRYERGSSSESSGFVQRRAVALEISNLPQSSEHARECFGSAQRECGERCVVNGGHQGLKRRAAARCDAISIVAMQNFISTNEESSHINIDTVKY